MSNTKHDRGAVEDAVEHDVSQEDLDTHEDSMEDEGEGTSTEPTPDEASTNVDAAALSKQLNSIQSQIDKLKQPKKVASGSKPRPNVVYTLLKQPPKWSETPQVAQLEQILFGQEKRSLQEPELFDLIKKGYEEGVLRTTQNPIRIFQFYRSTLRKEGVLQYQ